MLHQQRWEQSTCIQWPYIFDELSKLPTLAPNEKLWEILIKIIISFSFNRLQILIGFEPPGQLSVLGIVEYILNLIFSVENHRVTTRKMDSQMIYSWSFHMHRNSMILWQT